jgi:bifunctional enzyme CysN/CysC
MRQRLHLVIGGHVDHGKSTVVGRLLADTGALPDGKLEAVRALCERTARPFEYAFLLDALKDERAQGITIDTARVFFKTAARDFIILDAPGHIEFLKNMVTGASHAEAALLVIDAKEGVRENSRRHGYLMGMLGIRQLAVLVNKMDLVHYDNTVFAEIVSEYRRFLRSFDVEPLRFIPVAAREGENIARRSGLMPWYDGPTVLELLDQLQPAASPVEAPFRMPVQDVYKFTADGDDRRIVAGTIDSGAATVGDELVFYPSGKKARIQSIEAFGGAPPARMAAGEATGFTLDQQIYLARGELAAREGEPRPEVTTRLRASLFWLGQAALEPGKDYALKLGSARVPMRVEEIHTVLNADTLSTTAQPDVVGRHEVADCTLRLGRALAFDLAADNAATGRFVVVDDYEIRGGGIVREALPDRQAWARDKVLLRNYKWEPSFIPVDARAERHGQRATLLLLTGPADDGPERKRIARELEARLFAEGRLVYFLGIGNVLYGVDADLERDQEQRTEHLRRLAEVANILLDAGTILIVTAAELTMEDLDLLGTGVPPERMATAWLGPHTHGGLVPDIHLDGPDHAVERLHQVLSERAVAGPAGGEAALQLEPSVIWFTGLSGAGKSTIADLVAAQLRSRGLEVERLDGDTVRHLFPGTGFTRADREEHVRRIGFLAETLERHGVFVVASFISPFEESRRFVRERCRSFVEVHVSTPLEECERRDVKGLYARARRGEIPHFTGISDPYEPPSAAELTIDASKDTPAAAAAEVMNLLRRRAAGGR